MNSLKDKTIISTRPLSENDSIKNLLIYKGAKVIDFPMIEICDMGEAESQEIATTLESIGDYNWLVFTSKNGVLYFFNHLRKNNMTLADIVHIRTAVISHKTAKELRKYNIEPNLVSTGNNAKDLFDELKDFIDPEDKILLPLAKSANDELETSLSEIAKAVRINVYQTNRPSQIATKVIKEIKANNYDIIIFTSPSGVQNFKSVLEKNAISADIRSCCIGTTTESEMLKNNITPMLVSHKSEGEAFVAVLENFYDGKIKNV